MLPVLPVLSLLPLLPLLPVLPGLLVRRTLALMLLLTQSLTTLATLPRHSPSGRGTRRRTSGPPPYDETRPPPHTPMGLWGRHKRRGRGRGRLGWTLGVTLACVCLALLLGSSLAWLSWRQALLLEDVSLGFNNTGVSQAGRMPYYCAVYCNVQQSYTAQDIIRLFLE